MTVPYMTVEEARQLLHLDPDPGRNGAMNEELFTTDAETVAEFQALMSDPAARQAFVEAKARAAKTGAKVRYSHILRLVCETPWAIRPSMLAVIVDVLAFRVAGGRFTADETEQRVLAARQARGERQQTEGAVAVLPIEGVIIPKATAFSEMSGGTSLDGFQAMFRAAVGDDNVKAVVLDIDSPGGVVQGVPEMAAEIRAARGSKPIVAIANHEAASAAYWLGSQAEKFYVTKSGRVGSIGVYTTHENRQGEAAQMGIEHTLVSAGEYKTEGNPYEPLSDEGKAYMQTQVNEFYSMFVNDVAKGRGSDSDTVRSGFGQGRMVLARQAVRDGMVDGVSSMESVIKGLLAMPGGNAPLAANDDAAAALSVAEQMPDLERERIAQAFDVSLAQLGEPVEELSAEDIAATFNSETTAGEDAESSHSDDQTATADLGEPTRTDETQADAGTDDPATPDEPSTEDGGERRAEWESVLDRADALLGDEN